MIRKYISFCAALSLLFLCGSMQVLFSQSQTLTLGGKNGWQSFSRSNGITISDGRFGYDAVHIDSNSAKLSSDIDLLLPFETAVPEDIAGNYTVVSSSLITSPQAVMGKQAAVSSGTTSGLRLKGTDGSVFGTAGYTGSFSIEFWLYPSIAENGEQLFSWRSSINNNKYALYQSILASIFNNKVEWKLSNVFKSPKNEFIDVTLSSYSNLIPGKWSQHCIAFDSQTGLLEYRINGRIEAVKYITSNGRENGEIYAFQLGVPAFIEIVPRFTGLIDDFLISNHFHEASRFYGKYSLEKARFETQPLRTASRRSSLENLTAEYNTPPETDVAFFVRAGDNFYQWTDTFPAWIPVNSGEKIDGIEGLYFQVAAELYSNGQGTVSPSITSITLTYIEDAAPLPPARVSAEGQNAAVEVSWSASIDFDISGYVVYYGERPYEYTYKKDAGKNLSVQIDSLTNGKIYYFAVAAYDSFGPDHAGDLSKEVYARPLLTKDMR